MVGKKKVSKKVKAPVYATPVPTAPVIQTQSVTQVPSLGQNNVVDNSSGHALFFKKQKTNKGKKKPVKRGRK